MKKLLIIQTGTTFPAIIEENGDFADFIIKQVDLPPDQVLVSPVYREQKLPGLEEIAGVILTGSHSMVTDYEDWSVFLTQWLKEAAQQAIPILGICYGHQLVAQAFGGEVGYHPQGKEIGTVAIELTEEGKEDPLLGSLPANFWGHVTHSQTVFRLPPQAQVLAKNNFEHHHAFVLNYNIWGVQFHPEFNADITRAYIREQEKNLLQEGYNLEELYNSVQEHAYGKLLLKKFISLLSINSCYSKK